MSINELLIDVSVVGSIKFIVYDFSLLRLVGQVSFM